jgi:hypothetical protein
VVGQKPINRCRAYLFESIRPPRWEQMLNTAASFLDGPNGTNWARNPKIDNHLENREALGKDGGAGRNRTRTCVALTQLTDSASAGKS